MLATMAKQEAKRLSERVIAGMRKTAAKGTKTVRVDAETETAIRRLLRGGTGINKTALDSDLISVTVSLLPRHGVLFTN